MINFIVNVHSGRGRGQKTLKKIIEFCYKNSIEYTVHITGSAGHATLIARALCQNGAKTIVAVGGDGTFHEVLGGIIDTTATTLGFIPSGRGNDFAHSMGIPLSTVKALKIIARGQTTFIDFIDVGGARCLNVAGTGLDIDVLQRVAGRQGKLTYIKSLIYCLKNFQPYDIEVEQGGEVREYSAMMVGVCNGRQIGGGMKISPQSIVDDGLLNLVILNMPKSGRILSLLPKFVKGKHIDMALTTHLMVENVVIRTKHPHPIQLDGEIYQDHPFDCKIQKSHLKTFQTQ